VIICYFLHTTYLKSNIVLISAALGIFATVYQKIKYIREIHFVHVSIFRWIRTSILTLQIYIYTIYIYISVGMWWRKMLIILTWMFSINTSWQYLQSLITETLANRLEIALQFFYRIKQSHYFRELLFS